MFPPFSQRLTSVFLKWFILIVSPFVKAYHSEGVKRKLKKKEREAHTLTVIGLLLFLGK